MLKCVKRYPWAASMAGQRYRLNEIYFIFNATYNKTAIWYLSRDHTSDKINSLAHVLNVYYNGTFQIHIATSFNVTLQYAHYLYDYICSMKWNISAKIIIFMQYMYRKYVILSLSIFSTLRNCRPCELKCFTWERSIFIFGHIFRNMTLKYSFLYNDMTQANSFETGS